MSVETWNLLCYTAGRPYDGYAHGIVDGEEVSWPIRHKQMARYAGATVVEHPRSDKDPRADEDTALDFVLESSLNPMSDEQVVAWWSARGSQIGTVLPSGEISWRK